MDDENVVAMYYAVSLGDGIWHNFVTHRGEFTLYGPCLTKEKRHAEAVSVEGATVHVFALVEKETYPLVVKNYLPQLELIR